LKPRLAARFEPPVAPITVMLDEAPEVETSFDVERQPKAQPRKLSRAREETLPEAKAILPVQGEHPSMARSVSLLVSSDDTIGFVGGKPGWGMQNHREPLPMQDRQELSSAKPNQFKPVQKEDRTEVLRTILPPQPAELPRSHEETKNVQPAIVPLLAQPAMPRAGIDRAIESPSRLNLGVALQTQRDAPDQQSEHPMATKPMSVSVNQAKVIHERVEITRVEPHLRMAATQSQLVPAIPPLEPRREPLKIENEPPSPTIHVTIGRIEVKATTSLPSPKRIASSSPTMSLDEYLRRRQGGER
jgi:hypothetical protein